MTTIGVATHCWGMNYGGTLQSFALLKILEGFGYPAERVMYTPGREFPVGRKNAAVRLMKEAARCLAPLFFEGSRSLRRSVLRKKILFDAFRQDFLRESPTFRQYRELKNRTPRYDLAVAGSDQIWNPHLLPNTPFFMLDFVPPERRIAYAGSFGVEKIPSNRIPFFRDGLRQFAALSVREESGADIVENLLGKRPPVVLDPTFLFTADQWDEVVSSAQISDPPVTLNRLADAAESPADSDKAVHAEVRNHDAPMISPYILCYALPNLAHILPWAKKIEKITGKSITAICLSRNDFDLSRQMTDVHFVKTAGPAEFVTLFKNADFVVTNSFHGTAFSVLYHKPFVSIEKDAVIRSDQDGHLNRTDSRKIDFLKRIGLPHRFVSPNDAPSADLLVENFDPVDAIIAEQRAFSLNYLKSSVAHALAALPQSIYDNK